MFEISARMVNQGKNYVLVVNDKEKRGDVSNFRPITRLPVMWKLFTGVYAGALTDNL